MKITQTGREKARGIQTNELTNMHGEACLKNHKTKNETTLFGNEKFSDMLV